MLQHVVKPRSLFSHSHTESHTNWFKPYPLPIAMEIGSHATRSKGLSATANPSTGSAKLPVALRKLNSVGEWNFKPSGCSLPNLEGPIADDTKPAAAAVVAHPCQDAVEEEGEEKYFRFLGETSGIRSLFAEGAICSHCKKGQLDVTFETKCIATTVHTRCNRCHAHSASTTATTGIPQDSQDRNTNYAANIQFVLAQILSGNGGTETSRIIGMLDLPNPSIGRTAFPAIEHELSRYIIPYTKELLRQNLVKEVELYSEKKNDFDYPAWKEQHEEKPDLVGVEDLPALTVGYDMGWQKRSSGHRYDSHSGHAIPIGVLTNKPVGLAILNKHCKVCRKSPEPGEHDCLANFEGASGAMEASALLKIAHELLDEEQVLFGTIVADDDSSIRAQMKWSNADWMLNNSSTEPPRVLTKGGKKKIRPDRGQLRREYPEPNWLNDPSHRGKTLGGDLRSIEKQPKAISKGINKVDCLKLHRNFGYMVKQLKNVPEDQWEGRAKAVLEHHFEHHKHCDSSWCHRKNMSAGELNKDRGKKGKYYRCKERDSREYELLKSIVDKYTSIERLREVAHGHSTQMNESMNNTIAWLAQKNKTLSGSVALSLRIHLAVGINLVGYEPYLAELLNRMGITLTKGTAKHLNRIWIQKEKRAKKQKELSHKRDCQAGKRKKLDMEIEVAEKKRRKGAWYRPGEGFDDCLPVLEQAKEQKKICRAGCGGTDHLTSQSKRCLFNLANKLSVAKKQKAEEDNEIAMLKARIDVLEKSKNTK
jgi:hypothetical protein